jgi:N-acetylneuraminic acid mutarotase
MSADTASSGWFYAKAGASSGQPTGPLTWEDLLSLARSGGLTAADLVWNQSLPRWLPAGQIPELLPAQPAPPPPGPAWPMAQPGPQGPGPQGPAGYPGGGYPGGAYPVYPGGPGGHPSRKSRSWLAWVIPVAVLVLAGAGLGIYFGAFHGKDGDDQTGPIVTGKTTTTKSQTTVTLDDTSTTTSEATTTTATTEAGPLVWTQLQPAGAVPAARDGHNMVYDTARGKYILFGGYGVDNNLNDTWEYDPVANTWTELSPSGELPPARASFGMAYDEARHQVILFGGWSDDLQLDDTWAYDPAGNTWTQLSPGGEIPTARAYHAMVYDPGTSKVIMFGGWDDFASTDLNETWAYDAQANTWTKLAPAGDIPSARDSHEMVLDGGSGRILLFGGYDDVNNLGDTWAYDPAGNTWAQLMPSGAQPAPRSGHALTYDAARRQVILFGGSDGDFAVGDTWAYDPVADSWTELTFPGDVPQARSALAMVADPVTGRMILFGGYNDESGLADTWSLGG